MLKQFIFLCLRSAAGFFSITILFIEARRLGLLPQDDYEAQITPVYDWFYFATMVAWVAGTATALMLFTGILGSWGEKNRRWLAWAPLWMPIGYGICSFIWLARSNIF